MFRKKPVLSKVFLFVLCCSILFACIPVSAIGVQRPLNAMLTSNQAEEVTVGTKITLKASATGGKGGYMYKFVLGSNDSWTTLRSFNSSSTYEWTPAKEGSYDLLVYVLDRGGKVASKKITVQAVSDEPELLPLDGSLTVEQGSTVEAGSMVTLKASATGGTQHYQYKFTRGFQGEWTTLQNFSEISMCAWTPEEAGSYTLMVDIRDDTGNVVSRKIDITVTEKEPELPPLEGSLTSDQGLAVETGAFVTLRAEANGGSQDYQYQFSKGLQDEWSTLQEYSSDSVCVWNPNKAGSYVLMVDIKDSVGNVISKKLTILVSDPVQPLGGSLSADEGSPIEVGTSVQFTAKATGGVPDYQYEFVAEYLGNKSTLQEYGVSSSCTWTPSKAGTYLISVHIKDAKQNAYTKQMSFVVVEPPSEEQNGMCTGNFVNVRREPVIASDNIITRCNTGDRFVVLDKQNDWYQIKLSDGTVGWMFGEYVKLDGTDPGPSTTIKLSHTSGTIPVGKTFYVTGKAEDNSTLYWESDNPSVAIVKNGFIEAVGTGKANIIVHDASYRSQTTCSITVTEAEPIRFTYVSPNLVPLNGNATFVAITDQNREAVRFEVNINDNLQTIDATRTSEGNTYKWTADLKMTAAGTFTVKAYSKTASGSYQTCDDGQTTVFVTSSSDLTTTTLEKRRVSDQGINFIAKCEGYASEIYDDLLAPGNPTLGYGYVVHVGEQVYNNLTKSEAWAMLVDTLNEDYYASSVNRFLMDNQVSFNQQQFDSLVSFTYNLGSQWQYNDLGDILLNASGGSSSETKITGRVSAGGEGLNVRSEPSTSSEVIGGIGEGKTVTLVSATKYSGSGLEWYQIVLSNGSTGYVCADFIVNVQSSASGAGGRLDLNFVDRDAVISEISAYHHAGPSCIEGLLTRRFDELDIFLYGEYDRNYGVRNRYPIPSCFLNSHPEYR